MLRTVQVKNGKLKGLVGKDPRITVFRGVPYAKPPVGELRWKAPQQCAFRPRWRNSTIVIPKFSFHFPPALPALCWMVYWREN